MPGQHHKHIWFYLSLKPHAFANVGKEYWGLVYSGKYGNTMPILCFFLDRSWYEPATSLGFQFFYFEVGIFIEHKTRGSKDNPSSPDADKDWFWKWFHKKEKTGAS